MQNLKQILEEFEGNEKKLLEVKYSTFELEDSGDMKKAIAALKKGKITVSDVNDNLLTFDNKVYDKALDIMSSIDVEVIAEGKTVNEKGDIKSVIQALVDAKPSDDNAEQGKFVSLMKGLAFSDDPEATAFMKKLMGVIDKSFVE